MKSLVFNRRQGESVHVYVDNVEVKVTMAGWKGRSAVLRFETFYAEGHTVQVLREELLDKEEQR